MSDLRDVFRFLANERKRKHRCVVCWFVFVALVIVESIIWLTKQ